MNSKSSHSFDDATVATNGTPRRLRAAVGLLCIVVTGCAVSPETVTVNVPVPVRVAPPPELTAPLREPLPVFVGLTDPAATSCLTAEGETATIRVLLELVDRLQAWKAWAEVQP